MWKKGVFLVVKSDFPDGKATFSTKSPPRSNTRYTVHDCTNLIQYCTALLKSYIIIHAHVPCSLERLADTFCTLVLKVSTSSESTLHLLFTASTLNPSTMVWSIL